MQTKPGPPGESRFQCNHRISDHLYGGKRKKPGENLRDAGSDFRRGTPGNAGTHAVDVIGRNSSRGQGALHGFCKRHSHLFLETEVRLQPPAV